MATAPTAFVDTNVLVCSEDGRDAAKQARAIAWLDALWSRQSGRLSTQVLNEFYAIVTRKLAPAMPAGDARAEVRRYQRWQPWQIEHQTVEAAWSVESRYGLNYWDALIVASALEQGCALLLTEDLQHEQRIDGLRIVNPFVLGPELVDAQP
jgi:predicted nucleic acid-binding protein